MLWRGKQGYFIADFGFKKYIRRLTQIKKFKCSKIRHAGGMGAAQKVEGFKFSVLHLSYRYFLGANIH
jgi:hypothetical protein